MSMTDITYQDAINYNEATCESVLGLYEKFSAKDFVLPIKTLLKNNDEGHCFVIISEKEIKEKTGEEILSLIKSRFNNCMKKLKEEKEKDV